ncbi:MAG: serine/threonine protein kinase [Myxococcaceae bacterium]|nr:serine/threonine protein kinase [Myxococcaceae bacterium]
MPHTGSGDYSVHLQRLGLDPETLKLTSRGGIAAPAARTDADALPRVSVSTSAEERSELTVLKTLGTGGMGEVMLATQRALGREVALKRLSPHTPRDATNELLREALITGRLEHPNIVPVHMLAVSQEGEPFFVMKRIEGIPWRKLLRDPVALQRLSREKAEPLVLHLDIFLAVCDAVAFAHSRGVLHRDLKPDNVMVGAFGEVYVLDWGIAVGLTRDSGLPAATEVTAVTGTPAYMAPEMAAADGKALGVQTDVFLLGATLHELLIGRPPHAGDSPLDTLEQAWKWAGPPADARVPEGLGDVLARAMARAPKDRFASVDELRGAVVQYLRHRDAVGLAAEAKARAEALSALLGATGPADDAKVHAAFSEARFGYAQALRIWPGYETAVRGRDEVTTAMLRYELRCERPAAARALLPQLSSPDAALEAEVAALEAQLTERQTRLAALEKSIDLDHALAQRGLTALIQGIGIALFIVAMGFFGRRGWFTFGHREAVAGLVVFGLLQVLLVDRSLRPKLNEVGLRAMNANMVGNAGLIAFWAAAWAVDAPFHTTVVLFMLFIAVGWGTVATLFDARTTGVPIAYAIGTALVIVWPAAMFELFGATTIAAFLSLGYAWRRSKQKPAQTRSARS